MAFPEPPTPKPVVRRAGKAIAAGYNDSNDIALVDQWRAAHGYVLNTFKVWFRQKIKASGISAEFGQRLKRRNTVIDKLRCKRPDGSPLIADVTAMHDFAGCRLIFNDVSDLKNFREFVLSSEVLGCELIN